MATQKRQAVQAMSKIAITQKRSLIGQPLRMRRLIYSLGLRRISHRVVKNDNNCIRGMVNKAIHLLDYELLADSSARVSKAKVTVKASAKTETKTVAKTDAKAKTKTVAKTKKD